MKYIPHLFVVLALLGCGRKPGPAGAQGERGPAGVQGERGSDGAAAAMSAFDVLNIVDPCGDAPGVVDEVLLKLVNGQVLASFSDSASGQNTRFSILPPGNYITTDGSSCRFTLNANGSISY